MSSPPPGRALTFPIAWGRRQEHSAPTPKGAGDRSPSDEEVMARLQSCDSAPWRFSSAVKLALCLPLPKATDAIAARPRVSVRKRFFTCIRNQCFLTNQREVRRIGLLKSRFTEHWTGSRTWRAEASTLVQTLVLSAILYWGRRIWTVRSVPSSTECSLREPLSSFPKCSA